LRPRAPAQNQLLPTLINSSNKKSKKERKYQAVLPTDMPLISRESKADRIVGKIKKSEGNVGRMKKM
jgi:hypothetical protein